LLMVALLDLEFLILDRMVTFRRFFIKTTED
jgi:hypothetical protein